jgi:hypothetical protein
MNFEDGILNAKEFSVKSCKATVQKTGKLGFSAAATEVLGLAEGKSILVSELNDKDLAMVILPNSLDHRGFELIKSSNYFALKMKSFFDQRGYDYTNENVTIIYDIVKMKEMYNGFPIFKLTYREKKKRNMSVRREVDLQSSIE